MVLTVGQLIYFLIQLVKPVKQRRNFSQQDMTVLCQNNLLTETVKKAESCFFFQRLYGDGKSGLRNVQRVGRLTDVLILSCRIKITKLCQCHNALRSFILPLLYILL